MSRPSQARVPAGELRQLASAACTSCGFCGGTHGQPADVCHDAGGHCQGTWPYFVKPTDADPGGSWTRACSAASHANREEARAS
jgi:hypothetical protein